MVTLRCVCQCLCFFTWLWSVVAAEVAPDTISSELFFELEQLARIVDISYCVGTAGLGIRAPFECASHCADDDFRNFELLTAWNTGVLLADSCGYVALSHPPSPSRIILAFRGTYSIPNAIVDLATIPQEYMPYPGHDGHLPPPADPPRCDNCTVHTGFYNSWLNTRKVILPHLASAIRIYPDYELILVGHSLGGAVAALAALDLETRGWHPRVTTFGEPRVGNKPLAAYINARFTPSTGHGVNRFHRVTHASDVVPLLPLTEWGYAMHGEELYISAPSLPYHRADIRYCKGDEDPNCIAGADTDAPNMAFPARSTLWESFFAHRDYFWRLGLCVPGGDPRDWYHNHPKQGEGHESLVQKAGEL